MARKIMTTVIKDGYPIRIEYGREFSANSMIVCSNEDKQHKVYVELKKKFQNTTNVYVKKVLSIISVSFDFNENELDVKKYDEMFMRVKDIVLKVSDVTGVMNNPLYDLDC